MVRPDHSQQHKAAALGDLLATLLQTLFQYTAWFGASSYFDAKSTGGREICHDSRVSRAQVGDKLHEIWGSIE